MLISTLRPRARPLVAWVASLAVVTAACSRGAPGTPTPARTSAASPVTAFINVTVIPMDTERVLAGQTVVVRDGRIAALGPAAEVAVPRGAVQIDGQGKYLLPGLADMHTHIAFFGTEHAERLLFLTLANGITTIRNADYDAPGTPRPYGRATGVRLTGPELLRLRARVAAGELWSPRIYTSAAWHLDSSKSVLENIAAYKAAGYDFIKTRQENRAMTVDSLIPAAKRVGIPFGGHIEVLDPMRRGDARVQALQLGYRVIDHLHGLPQTWQRPLTDTAGIRQDSVRIAELAAATTAAGVWDAVGGLGRGFAPTPLERRYGVVEFERLRGMRLDSQGIAYIEQEWVDEASMSPEERHSYRLIRALQDSGAGLTVGTDMPALGFAGFDVHRVLQGMVQWAGLTPYQALVAATRNPAAALGALDSAGTVAVGKRADLVLLTGNPLIDIRHTGDIAGVMAVGRWLSRAEIDRRLDRYYRGMRRPGRD